MADQPLLARLDDYPDALLIAGCDWSAMTAITRLFKRLPCFADSSSGHDDELDGALLLSGLRGPQAAGRHCFQTTYVGERFASISRTSISGSCGSSASRAPPFARCSATEGRLYRGAPPGDWPASRGQGASRLEKACAAYLASIRQTLELKERLGERVAVVDYDELAAEPPGCCLRYAGSRRSVDNQLLRHLHGKSVRKGVLASWEATIVDQLALPAYRRARLAARLSLADSRDHR